MFFGSTLTLTPHLLMVTSDFDGYGEHENDYCKVQFSQGVVTDLWKIRKKRTILDDKE